jgi:hypothetical protein
MNNVKQKIIDEIQNNVSVFRKISPIQYVIRCPICGDSQKDLRDAHCYLKASFDPNEPILYNCFKCNSGGRVTKYFLEKLNISLDGLSDIDNQVFNRISTAKKPTVEIISGTPKMDSKQTRYIESRLGKGFSIEDYEKFKIIWNMDNVIPYITDSRVKSVLPNNMDGVSFLSEDKSVVLTRFYDNDEPRWKKSKIFPSDNKSVYTIKSTIDIFSKDIISVNIAEGVFDVLSIYKNFNNGDNSIFIATLGSDYEAGLEYTIDHGIMGSNIRVNLYIDNNINEKQIKMQFKKYKWLFGEINIYKNIKAEDVGKKIDDIKLVEYRV